MEEKRTGGDVRLFCLGSPLVDVTANVDAEFLRKYRLNEDNAYSVDDLNRTIFDGIRRKSSVEVGGSVTNTARVIRRLCGNTVTYLGTIGDDEYGTLIKRSLDRENLGSELTTVEGNTGKVAVLLNGKARTLVTDLAASKIFTLDERIYRKIKNNNSLIYISGFFISVSPPTITRLINTAKPIAFNLGAPFLSSKFPHEMTQLYLSSSIIFGNEAEHRAFARIHDIASADLLDVVVATNQILPSESRVVIVTRGGGAVLVVRDSHWWEFEVRSVEVVDSNGAGDAFVGGFLARYVGGRAIDECVRCGIRVARGIVQSVGFNLDPVDRSLIIDDKV